MAATEQGSALTEWHRTQQLGVKASATDAALALWPLLDADDLDTVEAWLNANVAVVRQLSDQSVRVAQSYFSSFAQAETGMFYTPPPPFTLDVGVVRRNLTIAGPITAKSLIGRGHPLDKALGTAQTSVAGESARMAMYAHRETLAGAPAATYGPDLSPPAGWARVTASKPCAFCAMLAGRGPVYGSQSSGGFRAHGNCACTVEPVFNRDAAWPGRANEFRDQYDAAIAEARAAGELQRATSNDLLNAFRRSYNP